MTLSNHAPAPRATVRRPNYPAVLAASALLVLASCGGKVSEDGSDGEAAGSAGQAPMPMPSGAGAGGSYDPGTGGTTHTGGTGGSVDTGGTGGTVETGGTGGYSGMPSGAGAGGSYEPETGGSAGDAGMVDPDSGWEDHPCVGACIENHHAGWSEFLGMVRPCSCEPEECGLTCASTLCGESPAQQVDEPCGVCNLMAAQTTCIEWFKPCFQQPNCTALVNCLLACQ